MFKDTHAFSSFSVNDLQKAKEFYGQTLGLEISETKEGLGLKIAGGGVYRVVGRQRTGRPARHRGHRQGGSRRRVDLRRSVGINDALDRADNRRGSVKLSGDHGRS